MAARILRPTSAAHVEAIEANLKTACPAGGTVYGRTVEVNRTGTVRYVILCAPMPSYFEGGQPTRPTILNVTQRVATLLSLPYDEYRGAIRVGGAGFDPASHVVGNLSWRLYGEEYALKTERL